MKRSCPICKKLVDSEASPEFPFCSDRCRLLDLGNWSSEKYVISSPAFDESMFERLERELQAGDEQPSASRQPRRAAE
jgi:endogenous inhibitor of DNA gyrase (YacG/DUF329 family)